MVSVNVLRFVVAVFCAAVLVEPALGAPGPHETGFPHPHPHPPGYMDNMDPLGPPGGVKAGGGQLGDGHGHSHGSHSQAQQRGLKNQNPNLNPVQWSQPLNTGSNAGGGGWIPINGGGSGSRTKRQWYDHSDCHGFHCHDVYSDGHEHVRGANIFDLFNYFGRR